MVDLVGGFGAGEEVGAIFDDFPSVALVEVAVSLMGVSDAPKLAGGSGRRRGMRARMMRRSARQISPNNAEKRLVPMPFCYYKPQVASFAKECGKGNGGMGKFFFALAAQRPRGSFCSQAANSGENGFGEGKGSFVVFSARRRCW